MAGVLGVDPGPFSIRELYWMAEGRRTSQWDHTALLAATVLNSRQGITRAHLIAPRRLHPDYQTEPAITLPAETTSRMLTSLLGSPSST